MQPIRAALTAKQQEPEIHTEPSFFQRWGRQIQSIGSKAATVAKVALVVGLVIGLAVVFTPAAAAAAPLLQSRNIQPTDLSTSASTLQASSQYRAAASPAPHLTSGSLLHAAPEVQKMQTRLAAKRATEQASMLSFSAASPLFPSALGTPAEKGTLCISGIEGVWRDKTRTLLFMSNGTAIQRLETESQTITSQLSSQAALDLIESSCGDGYYHFINQEGTSTIHSAIASRAVATAPYVVATGAQKPTIAKLLNNQAVVAWLNNTSYYYSRTDGTGRFPTGGFLSNGMVGSMDPRAIGFTDGSSRILHSSTTASLFQTIFDALGTFVSSADINNRQSLFPIMLPRTPIPADADFIPILSAGPNGDTPTIYTYDNTTRKIISSRALGSEPVGTPKPELALCGDYAVTLRPSFDTATQKYVMKMDMVDPAANSTSVVGGEAIVPVAPTVNATQAQVSCFADGMIVATFADETTGEPIYMTINRVAATPTTTPSPAIPSISPTVASPSVASPSVASPSVASPSGAPSGLPSAVSPSMASPSMASPTESPPIVIQAPSLEIDVTQIGLNYIPINTVLNISNGTAYITLKDADGFDIVYSINCSKVPVGTEFTPVTITGLEIAKGNATKDSTPVFDVCNDDRTNCSVSRRKTSLEVAGNISDAMPLWQILVIAMGAGLTVGGIGLAVYLLKVRPSQKKKQARNVEAAELKEKRDQRQKVQNEARKAEYERTAPERAAQAEEARERSRARFFEKLHERPSPPTEVIVDQ
jgi:uncharacterized membrane-anchored protein YhcB (DUF1043 family)